MFLKMSVGVIDKIMVGQLGESAIAGVGVAEQLVFFLLMLFSSISAGVNALASQSVGAGRYETLRPIFGSAMLTGFASAFFFNAIFLIWPRELLAFLGANSEIASAGTAYLKITSFSVISITLTFMMTSVFRAFSDNKTPMYASAAAIVINTLLAFLFIFVFRLGIAGAAWAALIARFSELFIMAFFFERKREKMRLSLADSIVFDKKMFGEIFRVGWPVTLDMLVWQMAGIATTFMILNLGTAAAGANEVIKMMQGAALMPVVGIAMAASSLVGQSLGRVDFNGARRIAERIIKISFLMVLLISVATALFAFKIPSIFNFGPETKLLAANSILMLCFFQIVFVLNICVPGILRAGGDTKAIIYISGSAMWFIGLPLAYLLGIILKLGLYGVIIGVNVGETSKAIMFYRRYKRGLWMKKII
ncbi:MAG: Multidrug resistance protein NorM [bacterium ADurb.Bin243]|nr:MAG: Multidrug resistance protein NorM [bacterium ADurb.Bin243]